MEVERKRCGGCQGGKKANQRSTALDGWGREVEGRKGGKGKKDYEGGDTPYISEVSMNL